MCGINSFPSRAWEWSCWWIRELMGEVSVGLIGWAVITVQHSTDAGTLLVFIYLYMFFMSAVATSLDDHSGLLSMLGWAHITKLCKDIGKEVETVCDPNTQRFGSSLKVGHTWKRFQTESTPLALSWGHLLWSLTSLDVVPERGSCRNAGKQSQSVLSNSLEMLLKDSRHALANALKWNSLI